MSKSTATVLVVALVAAVATFVLWRFQGSGSLELSLPGAATVKIQGENPQPPAPGQVTGKDLQAGGDISAQNRAGGGVAVERAKAGGGIDLGVQTPGSSTSPK